MAALQLMLHTSARQPRRSLIIKASHSARSLTLHDLLTVRDLGHRAVVRSMDVHSTHSLALTTTLAPFADDKQKLWVGEGKIRQRTVRACGPD